MDEELLIQATGIQKIYEGAQGQVVLKGLDVAVREAEFVAVMGPSGSGKSTLLSIIGGLNPPTGGDVALDGIRIYKLGREKLADFRREYLGFVFQEHQLIPYLTAAENVMVPLTVTAHPASQHRAMAEAVLDKVGLAGKYGRLPSQLSIGEQERVAVARAIVNEPPILLADEPTGSLDTQTGQEIMNLLKRLNEEDGLTIFMVTHNPENAREAQRTIFVRDGRIAGE